MIKNVWVNFPCMPPYGPIGRCHFHAPSIKEISSCFLFGGNITLGSGLNNKSLRTTFIHLRLCPSKHGDDLTLPSSHESLAQAMSNKKAWVHSEFHKLHMEVLLEVTRGKPKWVIYIFNNSSNNRAKTNCHLHHRTIPTVPNCPIIVA